MGSLIQRLGTILQYPPKEIYQYIIVYCKRQASLRLTYLKPTRHLSLKNTIGVILLRHPLNILSVLGSITVQRVLRAVRVVEVDVLVVRTLGLGVFIQFLEGSNACVAEELVVGFVFPGVVE